MHIFAGSHSIWLGGFYCNFRESDMKLMGAGEQSDMKFAGHRRTTFFNMNMND